MSQSGWLVAGIIPGINRQPLKKLAAAETALLGLRHPHGTSPWAEAHGGAEAERAGRKISRIVVAFEAGRDGFWLGRWLRTRGIEAHVIHATSVAVSREHRRAKTDRLDTELLKRAFLGWRRGERGHRSMAAIPTLEEEDAKRPNREREGLVSSARALSTGSRVPCSLPQAWRDSRLQADLTPGAGAARRIAHTGGYAAATEHAGRVAPRHGAPALRDRPDPRDRSRTPGTARAAPQQGAHAMVRRLAQLIGVGVETADMLVHESLSRNLRDRTAVARYAGLTGAPDESGARRREKGLARPAPGTNRGPAMPGCPMGLARLALGSLARGLKAHVA